MYKSTRFISLAMIVVVIMLFNGSWGTVVQASNTGLNGTPQAQAAVLGGVL